MEQNLRIGRGFDIHRLETGRPLLLGGIRIDHDTGCVAHSDGDVLLHAVIDALLGAAGMGDIGMHFPDTSEEFRGADSRDLFRLAHAKVPGFTLVNLDMTVFCEQPRLSPYRNDIEQSVAELFDIDAYRINFKCKTMERTGAVGAGKAVSADAVILIQLKGM
jgi:2-C-methyl-D-erythritol 2,4-cyclodiphosphate synthase